ncbi:peptidylprolyl isomerase [Mesobacillus maritimus]|uniref:peptidylprolyl isomerase n=1 Tax=Mesobacillus maritimus TaxID=1643336 RepID=UPI0020415A5C|nr:peptidylprolyl isomerase [Mesobacillus maritimus]MCM3588452.1 peptidylprolyl isomerase [Mesobacillus maritimus]MCM3670223.1 peptidylprolyl isomerase [Mesobacillus maritimus]
MRKVWMLMFVLLMFIGLSACGTNSENDEAANQDNLENNDKQAGEQGQARSDLEPTDFPQLSTEVAENEQLVEMVTSMGTIKMKLFPDIAPKAVENFITHSEKGYYEGLTFHRVMNEFMIQGGDPEGTGRGGESIYGEPFEDEFSNQLFHLRGALSMANSGPNTNGSQFFIVQNSVFQGGYEREYPEAIVDAYEQQGGTPWLDYNHTVFGQVIEGMDVVDQIAALETDAADQPLEEVVIEKINVLE